LYFFASIVKGFAECAIGEPFFAFFALPKEFVRRLTELLLPSFLSIIQFAIMTDLEPVQTKILKLLNIEKDIYTALMDKFQIFFSQNSY
jgi:hypothetical protein